MYTKYEICFLTIQSFPKLYNFINFLKIYCKNFKFVEVKFPQKHIEIFKNRARPFKK